MDIGKAREILKIEDGLPEELLYQCDAIWIYQGKRNEPHAILTSGKHSDGYINLNAALQFTNICQILARRLVQKLKDSGLFSIYRRKIDAVASSSYAAITFGQEVARQIGAMFVFTEKEGEDQKWTGRFELPSGSYILQVEELATRVVTARKVKEAILASQLQVDFVEIDRKTLLGTVVYRPEDLLSENPDYHVVPLITKEIHNWTPEECSLCQKGSQALKPKPNWQRFLEH